MPMPVTLVPLRWPDFFFFSSHLNISAPLSSASFWKALVSGPRSEPILPAASGAFMRRIARRSTLSSRAALSIIGSNTATNWFSPGPRCGPTGGVLVSTGTARQRIASGLRKLLKRACVLFADEHRFEGPDRPERHDRGELIIFADDAVLLFLFDLQIFAQQTSSMLPLVRCERRPFLGRFVRHRGVRPDLSVRVRIASAHHRAAIFKNQDGIDSVFGAPQLILLGPNINYGAKFGVGHLRERQIMPRRKTYDAAGALFGARHEQS